MREGGGEGEGEGGMTACSALSLLRCLRRLGKQIADDLKTIREDQRAKMLRC